MKRKSGDGWTFITADGKREPEPVEQESLEPAAQRLRVNAQKGARGKWVTRVREAKLSTTDLQSLLKALKKSCGVGGSLRDGEIELQGDCTEKVTQWLRSKGWGVRD